MTPRVVWAKEPILLHVESGFIVFQGRALLSAILPASSNCTSLMSLASCPHGVYDRSQALADIGESILNAQRYLWIHATQYQSAFLHLTQVSCARLLRNGTHRALRLAETASHPREDRT